MTKEELILRTNLLLEKVAESDGEYSIEAKTILEEMFEQKVIDVMERTMHYATTSELTAIKDGKKVDFIRSIFDSEAIEFLENNLDKMDLIMEIVKKTFIEGKTQNEDSDKQ